MSGTVPSSMLLVLAVALVAPPPPAVAQPAPPAAAPRPIVVASKPFGESFLLAEMFAQLLESRGITVARRPGLGATELVMPAMQSGEVDVFPEYTGTGLLVILKAPMASDPTVVLDTVTREFAARYDIRWLAPLGFENTYAMSVRTETATRLGLRTLSDAAAHSRELRAGFTADFIGLPDGLPGLRRAYGLTPVSVRPLAPGVKYQALAEGAVDIIDAYSTDGFLDRYPLTVLEDDKRFFPPYHAAALVRGAVARARPEVVAALTELSGRIDVRRMRRWNARLEVAGDAVGRVARDALAELGVGGAAALPSAATSGGDRPRSLAAYLWERRAAIAAMTLRHLWLTAVALVMAVAAGVALGLVLTRSRWSEPVTRVVGTLQTVPGIALLAFMLPFVGIGVVPAILALFLYSLYPIVRATVTGIRDVDPGVVEAAHALGMTPRQVLRDVRVPLAVPAMMAGIRTAAVIAMGTATLAAFVGGGGLGEPIVAGLALADQRMVLSGAIPAAVLAVLGDLALGALERMLTPAALRSRAAHLAGARH